MIAPAFFNFAATVESAGGTDPRSAKLPAVVFIDDEFVIAVAILSLTIIGIPCNGPKIVPLERIISNIAASVSASGLVSMSAFKIGLTSAIRNKYAYRQP